MHGREPKLYSSCLPRHLHVDLTNCLRLCNREVGSALCLQVQFNDSTSAHAAE